MKYDETSLAHALEDAYDRELLANVPPSGWRNPWQSNPDSLLVIGAVTAGLIATRTAAMLGAKVALIERDRLGGNSLNYKSVPSKTMIRTSRNYGDMRGA